jgi:hypothetical protein
MWWLLGLAAVPVAMSLVAWGIRTLLERREARRQELLDAIRRSE